MLTISMVFNTFDCSKARCILNGKLVFYANDSDKSTRLRVRAAINNYFRFSPGLQRFILNNLYSIPKTFLHVIVHFYRYRYRFPSFNF